MNINQKIRKLLVKECACYTLLANNVKDYCDREHDENCRCLIFKNKRCRYFEASLLPMNPQLEALYQAKHKAKIEGRELSNQSKELIAEEKSLATGKFNKHCKKCGNPFQANDYRSQYCEKCRKYVRRESTRKSMSKKRKELTSM